MRGADACESEEGPQPGRGETAVWTVVAVWLWPTVTSTVFFNKAKVCRLSARPSFQHLPNTISGLLFTGVRPHLSRGAGGCTVWFYKL